MKTPRTLLICAIVVAGLVNIPLLGQVGWVYRGATATATPMPVFAPPFPPPPAPPTSPGGMFDGLPGMAAGFVPIFGPMLWVPDGRAVMGLSLLPPFAILQPPFPIAAAAAGMPAISGLEYDMLGATLWACN